MSTPVKVALGLAAVAIAWLLLRRMGSGTVMTGWATTPVSGGSAATNTFPGNMPKPTAGSLSTAEKVGGLAVTGACVAASAYYTGGTALPACGFVAPLGAAATQGIVTGAKAVGGAVKDAWNYIF